MDFPKPLLTSQSQLKHVQNAILYDISDSLSRFLGVFHICCETQNVHSCKTEDSLEISSCNCRFLLIEFHQWSTPGTGVVGF